MGPNEDNPPSDYVLREALADCLIRAISSGPIVKALTASVETPAGVKFLLKLAERIVIEFTEMSLPDGMQGKFQTFEEAITRIIRWARCIVALLSPIPLHLEGSVAMVEDLMRNKAWDFFMEEGLRDALSAHEFWQQKMKAAQETAEADCTYSGPISESIRKMKSAQNIVQSMMAVKDALALCASHRDQLRPGAFAPLESVASTQLLGIAQEVLASDSCAKEGESLSVDCAWLIKVLSDLPPAQGQADVADIILRLSEWQEANSGALLKKELVELADKTPVDAFKIQDFQRILDAMQASPGHVKEVIYEPGTVLICRTLKTLTEKARCICCCHSLLLSLSLSVMHCSSGVAKNF